MGGSLQDQLLNMGLVDEKSAKKTRKEKAKKQKMQRKNQIEVKDDVAEQAAQARQEKAEKDRELNQQRKAEADKKAIAAQVKQMIEMNRLNREQAEVAYNFADGATIKKILVDETMQKYLGLGKLAVVRLGDSYELVPTPVAERIAQRDEASVVLINERSTDQPDEDDPYADYQIPDDLMW